GRVPALGGICRASKTSAAQSGEPLTILRIIAPLGKSDHRLFICYSQTWMKDTQERTGFIQVQFRVRIGYPGSKICENLRNLRMHQKLEVTIRRLRRWTQINNVRTALSALR